MSVISINGNSLDTEAPTLRSLGLESEDASKSDYILVKTAEPLSPEQKEELTQLEVVIQSYVSENTYLCAYKPSDLEKIRELSFVSWANVYLELFVVSSSLKPAARASTSTVAPEFSVASTSRTPHTVEIILHDNIDPNSEKVKTAIATSARADIDSLTICRRKIRVIVQEQYLDELAAIDAVREIQEVQPVKLHNDVARSILKADIVINGTAYHGRGQVVAVADTGFDTGDSDAPLSAFTGRVAKLYDLGRSGKTDDPDGHGTHVCGSVLGDGNSPTMGGTIRAPASQATLVMQSLLDSSNGLGGIPADLADLFETPYTTDGARTHTNSWGSNPANGRQLPYDSSSTDIDEYIWDHPDLVVCFAAGNDGKDGNRNGIIDLAQIGAQAAAKNCITVGATESLRQDTAPTYGKYWARSFPTQPILNDVMANNAEGMAAFSSRGPTKERRFKPDVVAPGTCILSTHSRRAPPNVTYGPTTDPDWFFESGTSMATPLVAGCVAVLRETLVKNGTSNPSAALIKALLINGAVEVAGQYNPSEAGPSPNNNSGFGRVSLADSIIIPSQASRAGFSEGAALDQGKETTITVKIPGRTRELGVQGDEPSPSTDLTATGTGSTLKVTLVWSDPAGAMLQNDLDLVVVASDGTERHGNMGQKPGFDRDNNVEQVDWTGIPAGDANITVRAFRITRFAQPFAVVWSIR